MVYSSVPIAGPLPSSSNAPYLTDRPDSALSVETTPPPRPRPGQDPRSPRSSVGGHADDGPESHALEDLLATQGEQAAVYKSIALRFICVETDRSSDDPNDEKEYDYMYVEQESQRYKPYRQRHAENPYQSRSEISVEQNFPDSYSWTLIFLPDRQHLFKFEDLGEEWYSLRRARVIGFTAPLPYSGGRTIYEWSGRAWVDAEN